MLAESPQAPGRLQGRSTVRGLRPLLLQTLPLSPPHPPQPLRTAQLLLSVVSEQSLGWLPCRGRCCREQLTQQKDQELAPAANTVPAPQLPGGSRPLGADVTARGPVAAFQQAGGTSCGAAAASWILSFRLFPA